jgi:alpha-ketoglutarate-dependent 2,4-dichlorophenoxyacetate dioxygenase
LPEIRKVFELRPLHPLFGAEVGGVDARAMTDERFAEIREAFENYSLLVLPGQDIADDEQLAFAGRFGPLEPTKVGTLGAGSGLVHLTNIGPDGSVVPPTHRQWLTTKANQLWHSDSSFKKVPALASLLSGREVPNEGGETEYVSMRAVWRELGDQMQRRLESLVAIHDYGHSRGQIDAELMTPEERKAVPPVKQVMVRRHPVTGEKGLYLGSHVSGIVGMPEKEARALVDELLAFATQPRFIYAHRWRRYDLILWDNRFTIHRGRPFPVDRRRTLVRATVAGDAPTVPQ